MPVTEQPRSVDEDERIDGESLDRYPGTDPGEVDSWEIVRVACPQCRRPIALIGDEERLPQHAVPPTAWHPFSASVCPGSGVPTEDLAVCEAGTGTGRPGLDALLALPAGLDWRTQPFSHPFSHPARMAAGPLGEVPRPRGLPARR